MDDETKFIDAVKKIPDDVIEAGGKTGLHNPKKIVEEIHAYQSPVISQTAFETVYFWLKNGGGHEALTTGWKLSDLAERLDILDKDVKTPQELGLIGSSVTNYQKTEPFKPVYIIERELFKGSRPTTYGIVNAKRQETPFSSHFVHFGEEAIKRAEVIGLSPYDLVPVSLEQLDEGGRTHSDPIIVDPGFVDVKLSKEGIKFARNPTEVIPGEILHRRLTKNKESFMAPTIHELKYHMTAEELESIGFHKYGVGDRTYYVGKINVQNSHIVPVILGYAHVDKQNYRLANVPLEKARAFIPVLGK